ncbi:MAG: hypothetical protein Q9203_001402 [Teloschistes exilis]
MDYQTRRFYRVQSEHSNTLYSEVEGFEARAHYMMPDSFYINKQMIQKHLRCQPMSALLSPFISLFDNQPEAINRASFLWNQGHRQVFVAEIHAPLLPDTVIIEPDANNNYVVARLPIWQTQERDTFIPMSSLQTALHVDTGMNTESEWLALDYIPRHLIKEIYVPDALVRFRPQSMLMMGVAPVVAPVAVTIPRPVRQPLPPVPQRMPRLRWMGTSVHPSRGRRPPSAFM